MINLVTDCGAIGNNLAADTVALQAAIQQTVAAGGGTIYIPPGSYYIGPINGTMKKNITFLGEGETSILVVSGQDSKGNWLDFTGSGGITFRNLKIKSNGAVVPRTLLLFASADVSPHIVSGIILDGVTIDAKSHVAHVYVFGVNYNNAGSLAGPGGLTIRDSLVIQRHNGVGTPTPFNYTTAVRLDGVNWGQVYSQYTTTSSISPGNSGILFENANFIDYPPGTGNGVRSNNCAFMCINSGLLVMNSGSIQSTGPSASVFYYNNEGLTFNSVIWKASDGSGNTVYDWLLFGGGSNGSFAFIAPFFSVPLRAFLAFDEPWGGIGGLHNSVIHAPDVGGNTNNCYFTLTTFPAVAATGGYWFRNVDFQLLDGANRIQGCGDISGMLRNCSAVVLPPGAVDYSLHVG